MGLLSRTTRADRTPRPARPARVRVRLSPAELRQTNQLSSLERKIGLGLAVYGPAATVLVAMISDRSNGDKAWRIIVAALLGAIYAICTKRTNRTLLGLAGLGFIVPLTIGPLLVYPYLGFMMFMMMRQAGDKRKLIDARIASGNTGPVSSRPKKDSAAPAVDAAGRQIPLPSKRYTPPKHRPTNVTKKTSE